MTDEFLQRSEVARRVFFERQGDLLTRLSQEGQRPVALFICCSDARVTPARLLGAQPGELFMLRNIANIVPPYVQTELAATSVLEYAILFLQVPHLIICGHTGCGGIQALDANLDISREPTLSRWLDLARPAQREVDFSLSDLTPDERHVAIVQQNVIHQLQNVQSYPFVRQALEASRLQLHGWVYYLGQQEVSYYDWASRSFVTLEQASIET